MLTNAFPSMDPALPRWLLASAILLVSALVLAEESKRLAAPYDQILSDDIYERAEGWREPQTTGDEWRRPKTEPQSRMKFGYDSTYEELRARDETRYSGKPISEGNVRPSTQINLGF